MPSGDGRGPIGALEYHERTAHTPERLRRRVHRLDWENKPIPYKIYEDVDRIDPEGPPHVPDVPALAALAGAADTLDAPPTLAELHGLCHSAVGVTKRLELGHGEHEFRAAACTGALYHIDLYLATADLADLPAGVYHYDPLEESFDVLRRGDHRGELVAATAVEPSVAEAPAVLVATSTWWRNAWKYRARTFRHAFWDGGTALANLLTVAVATGLDARVVAGFADRRVARLLGLALDEEGPVAVVPVGANHPAPAPTDPDPIAPETRPLSAEMVEYPLIHRAHAGGRLADGPAVDEWRRTAWQPDPGPRAENGGGVPLSPVGPERASNRPLDETIRRRGSARTYRRDPLNDRLFATILDRAIRPVPFDVAGDGGGLRFSRPYLIVSAIDGIPPGSYRYHPGEDTLVPLERGTFRRQAGHLALDQKLGVDAAVSIYFMADVGRVVDAFGDRGYRLAQLEAAIIAGRIYLAAYANRDVGATGLTFYDHEVTDFFTPDAADRTPMFLITLGRPGR